MNDLLKTIPAEMGHDGQNLQIEWKDGHKGQWDLLNLRKKCPCAVCRGGDFGPIGATTGHITVAAVVSLKKVGRYGLQITWRDNHDTGIYTYDNLRENCECEICKK